MSDPATNQLLNYRKQQEKEKDECNITTTGYGVPVIEKNAILSVEPRGPMLMQDVQFQDELAHFSRERIPERIVHAKGAGAFGYFEVTHDITGYCAAKLFSQVGKRTPIAVRFSTVAGELGSSDTARDLRGFAVKFYTEDGIWDLVGSNSPIFFIRDPVLFPVLMHTRRNPETNLRDQTAFWDFASLRPETTHQIMMIMFSDRGVPDGYRHMHGFGSHTFKLINAQSEQVYCKFHYKTDQGIKNLEEDIAIKLRATDPDYSTRDLYNSIANGNFPSWSFHIQVMTFDQAEKVPFNPFDVTKVWPQGDFPLIPVGRLVLDRNPKNFFAEVEQIAFSPAQFVPGIDTSPDKMLQGRLFSYSDTHRYRLGTNYLQLPVNRPFRVCNYQRDGSMCFDNPGGAPNYHPNSFGGPQDDPRAKALSPSFYVSGDVGRYDSGDEDNFSQARVFYTRVLDEGSRRRLVDNIATHMSTADVSVQERAIQNFAQVDAELGRRLTDTLRVKNRNKSKLILSIRI